MVVAHSPRPPPWPRNLATFFSIEQTSFAPKTGGACLYMPQDGHWLASFEVIPPPKVGFSRGQKNKKIPLRLKTVVGCSWLIPDLKFWKKSGQNGVMFSLKMLSRRSRLSRTSRAPSRLIRPRPIDCDAGPKQTVKSFPVFRFEHRQKYVFKRSGI